VKRVRASAAGELRPRSRAPALLALALAAASAAGAGFALTSGRPRQALAAQPAVTVRVVRPASPAPAAERSAAAVQRVPRPVPVSRTVPPKRSARLRTPAPDRTTRVVEAAVPARPTRPAKVAPTPRPQPKPKPITISDSFDADVIDPSIWHVVTSDPTVGVAEEQGRLVVTVGAGAAPGGAYDQIDAHVGTQCAFPGDFDASVDYMLLEWPAGDGVFVGLNAIFADAAVG